MTPCADTVDLFSDAVLENPYDVFRRLRELGEVVWLPRCQAYAFTRHAVVRQALSDHETFSSAQGVTLNSGLNDHQRGTLLGSDPPLHTRLRNLVAAAFAPREVNRLEAALADKADSLVAEVTARGSFDAVQDLAVGFPTDVVGDMIGLPRVGRHRLLQFSDSHFNACGPLGPHLDGPINARVARGWDEMQTASAYVGFMARRLAPGSVGARIFVAAERGEIDGSQAVQLLSALMGAGVDTTVRLIGNAVRCFSDHPCQWQRLGADPDCVSAALNEVLRYDSPSQMLARCTTRAIEIAGWSVPAGARVLLLFASANRDERVFPRADHFDIERDPRPGHLSFSSGVHACLGQTLARLEAKVVLTALLKRVERIDLDGVPQRRLNSVLRGYAKLPVRVTLAGSPYRPAMSQSRDGSAR